MAGKVRNKPTAGEPARKKRRTTRVTSKNQVTLPVAALRAAHLGTGDVLRVEVQGDGRLVLIRDEDPFQQAVGAFPGLSEAADLERERDAWT